VRNLKRGEIETEHEGKSVIRYKQQKLKKHECLQVSDEALKRLPDTSTMLSERDDKQIFALTQNGLKNEVLADWVLAASNKKRVTFHAARHTNATLPLSVGVLIETVSKLLGNSDIKTTQIYAKVIDKNKRDAVSRLDGSKKIFFLLYGSIKHFF